jgi:hypothetical protein
MSSSDIDRLIEEVVQTTTEAVEHYNYSEYDLRWQLGQLARRAAEFGRKDEIERIQRNTLDADSDVWSENDDGELISLAERHNSF